LASDDTACDEVDGCEPTPGVAKASCNGDPSHRFDAARAYVRYGFSTVTGAVPVRLDAAGVMRGLNAGEGGQTNMRTRDAEALGRAPHAMPSGKARLLLFAIAAVALAGCTHVGPKTVLVDRVDYGTTIADSWKQQTLLNIVKMRYMDLPVFMDVANIVSGYSLQTGVTVGGQLSSKTAVQGDFASASGQAIYTDRPTITYVPLTGQKFLHGLITPIDPKNIFFMIQAGYPADFLLGLTVESINGLRNRSMTGATAREADPEFLRVLQLLREVQVAGAFGMRVEEDKARGSTGVLFFRRDDVSADVLEKTAEIRRLLRLPDSQQKYTLTYSPVRGADNELAVNSRSMLQIMGAFASYLDVPGTHLAERRAVPAFENVDAADRHDAVRIHSGPKKPPDAFAVVQHRGHWFWIDDSDLQSKRALIAVVYLFTLAETGAPERLPLVTIPAQ
jgi:hypothetical protein